MYSSHVQWKRCKSKCLQDRIHGMRIDKSELKIFKE